MKLCFFLNESKMYKTHYYEEHDNVIYKSYNIKQRKTKNYG